MVGGALRFFLGSICARGRSLILFSFVFAAASPSCRVFAGTVALFGDSMGSDVARELSVKMGAVRGVDLGDAGVNATTERAREILRSAALRKGNGAWAVLIAGRDDESAFPASEGVGSFGERTWDSAYSSRLKERALVFRSAGYRVAFMDASSLSASAPSAASSRISKLVESVGKGLGLPVVRPWPLPPKGASYADIVGQAVSGLSFSLSLDEPSPPRSSPRGGVSVSEVPPPEGAKIASPAVPHPLPPPSSFERRRVPDSKALARAKAESSDEAKETRVSGRCPLPAPKVCIAGFFAER
jgi:hypothetical protein